MKYVALSVAFLLVISCSDSDKVSNMGNQQVWIDGIDYELGGKRLYLIGILETGIKSCISYMNFGNCEVNNCWIINGKYGFVSLKNLSACYLKDYIWIIDDDTIPSSEKTYRTIYGKHFVKLVLVDTFGDSISEGRYLYIDEPLKITMLSPVDEYEASINDTLVFQYKISGIDVWETDWKDTVYISTDKNVLENDSLFWEEGIALEAKFLEPPLTEEAYYWGIKVSNQDTAFYSEIRSIWIAPL